MPEALTPDLALGYLRELSADIRAAVLLDVHGEPLAGDGRLAAPARALFPREGPAELQHTNVFAARDDRHQLVVVTGPFALPRLTRHDLRTVLHALGGGLPPSEPIQPRNDAVEALLEAVKGSD
jgi:hypothetical protein